MTKRTVETIKNEQYQVEEAQNQELHLKNKLREHAKECYFIYRQETQVNESILTYFNGHQEFHLFEQMMEEMRVDQRNITGQFEEIDATLDKNCRDLDDRFEALYEEKLTLLREELATDG